MAFALMGTVLDAIKGKVVGDLMMNGIYPIFETLGVGPVGGI